MSKPGICSTCKGPVSGDGICPKCCLDLFWEADDPLTADGAPREVRIGAGRSFGDFDLLEQIGEGGMGVVFKAWQRSLEREMAVKMLRAGTLASPAEVKRFQVEAKAAARLDHPNIVRVYNVGEQDGQLFFSMDLVHGRSLSEIVGRTPLEPARAARYTRDIARAMDYAHARNILHRDLKPGNVMIDEKDQPRITDFGIAKLTDADGDPTISGNILGTPSYMSPEQASGKRGLLGPATDIYSMGAILYDLLTGRPPFRAHTPAETLRQVLQADPPPPRVLNRRVPRDLETICLKCLARDPAKRYETADQLAADLDRHLRGEPIRARRIGGVTRLCRWGRRNPELAVLGTVLVLMFGLMAAFSLVDAVDSARDGAYREAGNIRGQLDRLGSHVQAMRTAPALLDTLQSESGMPREDQSSEANEYIPLLKDIFERHAREPDGGNRFENLLLIHPDGEVLANYNPRKQRPSLPNIWVRDYFSGATNAPERQFYISKAYKSQVDEMHKIGISVLLRDPGGRILGVLAAMLPTEATRVPAGLETDRTKSVLVTEEDLSRLNRRFAAWFWPRALEMPLVAPVSNSPTYAVFRHPEYEYNRTNLVSIHHKHIAALLGSGDTPVPRVLVDFLYRDPVSAEQPRYDGFWVAGFCRVGDTHLVVVHQIRNRAVQVLEYGAAFIAALGLWRLALMWRSRRQLTAAGA